MNNAVIKDQGTVGANTLGSGYAEQQARSVAIISETWFRQGLQLNNVQNIKSDVEKNSDEYSGDIRVYKIPQIES